MKAQTARHLLQALTTCWLLSLALALFFLPGDCS